MSDHHVPGTAAAQEEHEEHEHPSWKQYKWVALVLLIITFVEVWVYYTPFSKSPYFNPFLITMSAVKFGIVVQMYMHLRYDHRLFRALFFGPLIIAMVTVTALLFLFHQLPPLF